MSELTQVLIPSEVDQLKWMNARLMCDLLRQKAQTMNTEAEIFAAQADGLKNILHSQLGNGTADKYEARVVEGQLQFHLKA